MDKPSQDATGDERQGTDANVGLRELALRLAVQRFGMVAGIPGQGNEPRLFVGRVPPDFPFALPQLPGGHVVGSVVLGDVTEIFAAAAPTAREVLNAYKEQLPAAGWGQQPDMFPRHGGFVQAMRGITNVLVFCRGEAGPGLTVQALDIAGKPTEVRIELNTYAEHPEHSPCSRQQRMRARMGQQMWEIFPPLIAPVGTRLQPEGGGGGDGRWHTSATLQADLMLAEVRAHYEGQLQDAGWTRIASGESGPVAWSRWSFSDEEKQPWRGMLLILEQSETPRTYYLLLRAEGEGGQSGSGGSSSFSYGPLMAGGRRTASYIQMSGTMLSPPSTAVLGKTKLDPSALAEPKGDPNGGERK